MILLFLVETAQLLFCGAYAGDSVKFIRQPANLTVVAGAEKASLQCSISNYDGTIQWAKDDFILPVDSNSHYSAISEFLGQKNLEIENVRVEDDGFYKCHTLDRKVRLQSRSAYLNVTVSPKSVSVAPIESGAIPITRQKKIEVNCSALASKPSSMITWIVAGVEIKPTKVEIRNLRGSKLVSTISYIDIIGRDALDGSAVECAVSHPATGATRNIKTVINIVYPPEKPTVSGKWNRTLTAGQILVLTCKSSGGNPLATLTWNLGGRMLEQSFQQHLNSSTSILHHQIQPSDHGKKLECRASNSATEIPLSTGRRLYVYFFPQTVEVIQFPAGARENGNVMLTCRTAASNPPANITWVRNGMMISRKYYASLDLLSNKNGGFFSISSIEIAVSKQDNGKNIVCRAENKLWPRNASGNVNLNIEFAPEFDQSQVEFNVTAGEKDFILPVHASANPFNVTYKWWKLPSVTDLSSQTREQWKKFPLQKSERLSWSETSGNLKIKVVDAADEGTYFVTATNSLGEGKILIDLNVLYSPTITNLQGPESVGVGDDVVLSCDVKSPALSPLRVKWVKKVGMDFKTLFLTTSGEKSELVLKNVTSRDRGVYVCEASNGINSGARKEFDLKIKFPASVERSQTPEKVAKPDVSTLPGQATLTCFGSGNPEPLFRWQRNGDDVTGKIISFPTDDNDVYYSSLSIDVIDPYDDVIDYVCEVSNELGQDSTEILLVPRGPPEPPRNLMINNVTHNSISLSWKPGFDGGAAQTFVLEYRIENTKDGSHRWSPVNIPYNENLFTIKELAPSSLFEIRMSSLNAYGESATTDVMHVQTGALQKVSESTSGASSFNFIIVVVAVAVFVILVVFVVAILICRRKRKNSKRTISIPLTAASSLQGSDTPTDKIKTSNLESQSMSRDLNAHADTLSRRSDITSITVDNRRCEISPSPDSTYSSLNAEERMKESFSGSQVGFSVPKSNFSDFCDRSKEVVFPRKVKSISGVDCNLLSPGLSYAEFARTATIAQQGQECADWKKSCDQFLQQTNCGLKEGRNTATGSATHPHRCHTLSHPVRTLSLSSACFTPLHEETHPLFQNEDKGDGLKLTPPLADEAYASRNTSVSPNNHHSTEVLSDFVPIPTSSYAVNAVHSTPSLETYSQYTNGLHIRDLTESDRRSVSPRNFAPPENNHNPAPNTGPVVSPLEEQLLPCELGREKSRKSWVSSGSSTSDYSTFRKKKQYQYTDGFLQPGYRYSFVSYDSSAAPILTHNKTASSFVEKKPGCEVLSCFQQELQGEEANKIHQSNFYEQRNIPSQGAESLGLDQGGALFV